MSNDNLNKITDQQTITSMEIADLLGKNHFDVLKAIRKMEPAWEEIGESKFALSYRTVEKQGKEKKVTIFKYEPKKHYHKKQGHRQPYTKLTVKEILA